MRALYYLRRSNECDPQDHPTVHGLAFAYMELGDMKLARKHFPAVLEIGGTRGPALPGQEWAARDGRPAELKARGPRKDGGLLSAWVPCGCFAGGRCRRFRRSAFEIGMQGKYGLDINDPQESHVLRALPTLPVCLFGKKTD